MLLAVHVTPQCVFLILTLSVRIKKRIAGLITNKYGYKCKNVIILKRI